MSRMRAEDVDDRAVANVYLREQPDEEEEEEEDGNGTQHGEDDEEEEDGYSVRPSL